MRFPDFDRFAELAYHQIEAWSAADLGLTPEQGGLPGPCTTVGGLVETALPARRREFLTGSPQEMAAALVARLAQEGLEVGGKMAPVTDIKAVRGG